jgi:hypothetical protein
MKFWSRYKPGADGALLFRLVEKILMIVKVKIDINQEEEALKIIEYLRQVLHKYLDLRKTNSKKFQDLTSAFDEEETPPHIFPFPNNEHRALNKFLVVFFYSWKEAFHRERLVLASEILKIIIKEVKLLTQKKGNFQVIKQIQFLFFGILHDGLKRKDDDLKRHLYLALFKWYEVAKLQNDFQESEYLQLFEESLFQTFKIIIIKNDLSLFKSFVYHLFTSPTPGLNQLKITNLRQTLVLAEISNEDKTFSSKISKIKHEYDSLFYSRGFHFEHEELDNWIKGLHELKTPFLEIAERIGFKIDENEINENFDSLIEDAKYHYKLNQYRLSILGILSFALFKERYEWVHYFLNYSQPEDANASWVENPVFELNFRRILRLIAHLETPLHGFDILWEDRHGADIYFYKAVILLLHRVDSLNKNRSGPFYEKINWEFVDTYSPEEKLKISFHLTEAENVLQVLFNENKLTHLFNLKEENQEKLKLLIKKIKNSIDENYKYNLVRSSPNPKRIEDFKKEIINSFHSQATIRCFIQKFEKKPRISLGTVTNVTPQKLYIQIDKSPFIDKNINPYKISPNYFGMKLGFIESIFLINKIGSCCELIQEFTLYDFLLKKKEQLGNFVLLGHNFNPDIDFSNEVKDPFNWEDKTKIMKEDQYAGFAGYCFENLAVYLFNYKFNYHPRAFLLKKSAIGQLVHFLPDISQKNKTSLHLNSRPFSLIGIEINFYSEDQEALNKALNNPPDWLKMEEDPVTFLNTKGSLMIQTKVDFRAPQDFEGYLFKIPVETKNTPPSSHS